MTDVGLVGKTTLADLVPVDARTKGADMNQQDFLKIMIEQIKGQNPLDSEGGVQDYFGQLVQFQSLDAMQSMTKAINLLAEVSSLSQSAGLLGRSVTAEIPVETEVGELPKPPEVVLAGMRVQHRFLGVLQRQKAGQLALTVGHQKLFDAARLHQADRRVAVHRFLEDGKVFGGHHHRNRGLVVGGEAHVAVGHDAKDTALVIDDRKTGDLVALHQLLCIGQRLVRRQRDRLIDNAGFEAFHPADLAGLRVGVEARLDAARRRDHFMDDKPPRELRFSCDAGCVALDEGAA